MTTWMTQNNSVGLGDWIFNGETLAINSSGNYIGAANVWDTPSGDCPKGEYFVGSAAVQDGFAPVDINDQNVVIGTIGDSVVLRNPPATNASSSDRMLQAYGVPSRITSASGTNDYLILGEGGYGEQMLWHYNPLTQQYQCDPIQSLIPRSSNWTLVPYAGTNINNNGCVVTKATGLDGKTDVVILAPVGINVTSYLNPAPGSPITSASATCVGEPVTLNISGVNAIPGYTLVTNYNWHVPGGIKGFNDQATGSPVTPFLPSDLTGTSITPYYPVVQQTNPQGMISTSGTETVSCDLTLFNGGTCTVTGPLNIVAPQCTITSVTMNPVGKQISGPGSSTEDLFLGSDSGVETTSNGININYTMQPTSPFLSGSAICAQVIASSIMTQAGSPYTITNALDKSFPYTLQSQTPNSFMCDSPAQRGNTPAACPLSIQETYQAYVMYLPNIPNAIYVPLKCVT
jgi:hypothetical protein